MNRGIMRACSTLLGLATAAALLAQAPAPEPAERLGARAERTLSVSVGAVSMRLVTFDKEWVVLEGEINSMPTRLTISTDRLAIAPRLTEGVAFTELESGGLAVYEVRGGVPLRVESTLVGGARAFSGPPIRGEAVVVGQWSDLAAVLRTDSDAGVALVMLDSLVPMAEQLEDDPKPGNPSFADCVNAAAAACGLCNKHSCIKQITWAPDGSCTIECKTTAECCDATH